MFVFPDCNRNNKQKYAKILIVLFTKWGFTIRYSTFKINVFESRHGLSSDNNWACISSRINFRKYFATNFTFMRFFPLMNGFDVDFEVFFFIKSFITKFTFIGFLPHMN